MAQWRIKEISDLTGISMRMLRHYDKVGLLKPSMRAYNGYRWYSEQDLVLLQRIVALKFFGFSLYQIKTIMHQSFSIKESLHDQQQMLQDQVESLRLALDALGVVLEKYKTSESLDWKHLIDLIERYRMAEEIKNTWASKLEGKQKDWYLSFRQKYPKEVKAWEEAVEAMNVGKLGDPEGPEGERIMKIFLKCRDAAFKYGSSIKHKKMTEQDASDLTKYINKCISEGIPFTPEGAMWNAKAIHASRLRFWGQLYQEIKKNLDNDPEGEMGKKVAKQWREFLATQCFGMTVEYALGTKLLLESVQTKFALRQEPFPVQAEETQLLRDILALVWINNALKAS